MEFHITRNEKGEPVHVNTSDGFMMISRAFDPEQDGWMESQLDPYNFPTIRIGRDTEYLVAEVNSLRRKLFQAEQTAESYRRAAGFR